MKDKPPSLLIPPPSLQAPAASHTVSVIGTQTQHHRGAAKVLPGGGHIVHGRPKEVHPQVHIIG